MFNFSFNQLLEPNISLHQIYEPNKSVSFGRIFRLGRFGNRIFFPLIAFFAEKKLSGNKSQTTYP